MIDPSLDQTMEAYHLAAGEFVKGNPEPYKRLFSQGDDVTLGNPFGPFRRGWHQVSQTMDLAATKYRDGEVLEFQNIATCVTADLAYVVEEERFRAKMGGSEHMAPVSLRTTSVFRPEDGEWKIVHRHADPITSIRSADPERGPPAPLWHSTGEVAPVSRRSV